MIVKGNDCNFIKPHINVDEEAEVISNPVGVMPRFTDEQIFDLILKDKLSKDNNTEETKKEFHSRVILIKPLILLSLASYENMKLFF